MPSDGNLVMTYGARMLATIEMVNAMSQAPVFEFDTVEWPRLMLGNGPPVVQARPTLPTSDGRLEVGCAGEERRWICSKRYAASTSSG